MSTLSSNNVPTITSTSTGRTFKSSNSETSGRSNDGWIIVMIIIFIIIAVVVIGAIIWRRRREEEQPPSTIPTGPVITPNNQPTNTPIFDTELYFSFNSSNNDSCTTTSMSCGGQTNLFPSSSNQKLGYIASRPFPNSSPLYLSFNSSVNDYCTFTINRCNNRSGYAEGTIIGYISTTPFSGSLPLDWSFSPSRNDSCTDIEPNCGNQATIYTTNQLIGHISETRTN